MQDLTTFGEPAAESVQAFMAALEEARRRTPADAWKTFVRVSPVVRAWRFFLSLDPYTRWGLVKPRGYPGDATLMDFAYGHGSIRPHVEHAGPVGQHIYANTSGAKQSQSARERIELLCSEISQCAATSPKLVLSIAAGHARELEGLEPEVRSNVARFIAVDIDPSSLLAAQRSAGEIPFVGVRRNVIKESLSDIDSADLVYSLGLFDYLSDEHADAVLAKMIHGTTKGGRCIVANLAPDAANLGYCEAIMDWWMVTRDEVAMRALGERAATVCEDVSIEVQKHGCFNYLTLHR